MPALDVNLILVLLDHEAQVRELSTGPGRDRDCVKTPMPPAFNRVVLQLPLNKNWLITSTSFVYAEGVR